MLTRIQAKYSPIADILFNGLGMKLQFQDSCIAERIMLHFAEMDAPALPVHDSFILHHGYGESGEVEETMRRAFYEEVGEHISKIDKEILTWNYRKDTDESNEPKAIDIDTIIAGDDDVSQWRGRHSVWYESEQAKHG